MAHTMLISTLESAATTARDMGNPMLFLNRLESVHLNWHGRTFATRGLGFLTFHWYVIESFKKARCPGLWTGGVRAFRSADFTRFGSSYDITERARPGDIDSLANFSIAIETWHNEAHMAVGMAFGISDEMMDPRINIYYREFWRLHYFINAKFTRELKRYDSSGSSAKKIERLETNQHTNLYRI